MVQESPREFSHGLDFSLEQPFNFQMTAIKFIPLSMPLNTESLFDLWGLNFKESNGMKPNDENLPGCVLCTWPLKFW